MREFIRSFSLNTLGIAAIVASLIVIVVSNPPRTLCDAEIENFQAGVKGFLYPDPQKKIYEPTYFRDRDICRDRNMPGACVALFSGLKKLLHESSTVSDKCLAKLGEVPEYYGSLTKSIDLIVRLAWGVKAPASRAFKNGWLNPSDIYLFCQLKARAIRTYGEERYNSYVAGLLKELPGASELAWEEAWARSLLSTNCDSL